MFNHLLHPERLWLLLPVGALYVWSQTKQPPTSMGVAHPGLWALAPKTRAQQWLWLRRLLEASALTLLVILLAQPQYQWKEKEIITHGVDMMICLDTSGSMAAEDMNGNRLKSAKKVVSEFIAKRENDRIGLVVFGNRSFTKCPVTLDHDVLLNLVNDVQIGDAGDGTAIGMAITTALNRLRDSNAKSQVIVLVTDGDNNAGSLGPKEAAELARDLHVKIYTIGIGSDGGAPIPVFDAQGHKHYATGPDGQPYLAKMNVADLVAIADATSGKFYKAQSTQKLATVFSDIDRLEKSKIQSRVSVKASEAFQGLGFSVLVLLLVLRYLGYRKMRYAS